MTQRKAVPATPVQVSAWDQGKIAERHGLLVRPEDRAEFALMLARAADLGLPVDQAVTTFKAARAAMAGVLVGKQKPASYADDRRRAFAAARHACLLPVDAAGGHRHGRPCGLRSDAGGQRQNAGTRDGSRPFQVGCCPLRDAGSAGLRSGRGGRGTLPLQRSSEGRVMAPSGGSPPLAQWFRKKPLGAGVPGLLGQPNHCDVSLCGCGGAVGMAAQVTALLAERDRWRSLADSYDWDRQTLAWDLDRLKEAAAAFIAECDFVGSPAIGTLERLRALVFPVEPTPEQPE